MTQIIDGKAIAAGVRRDVAADVAALSSAQTRKHSASLYPLPVPRLAVAIVGSRKDSQTSVNTKRKASAEVGICSSTATSLRTSPSPRSSPRFIASTLTPSCTEVDVIGCISSFHFYLTQTCIFAGSQFHLQHQLLPFVPYKNPWTFMYESRLGSFQIQNSPL
ncbi:unnamed protein product [Miscanthus lutarioriparius]|uniref:Uncharacterized protein n=1 Tax=Miscanthus lutarioriparius TaxID=422564 RepID=A0A811QMP1_9POAL|nr:unnamed protein product [Miscanthus lutarioriparius]